MDPLIGPVFKELDIDRQCRKMIKFMTFAFGGSKDYTGRSMKAVHTGVNVQPDQFEAIVRHLKETLEEIKAPKKLID